MGGLPIDSQITFLYTRDLQSSAHFYEEVLGLPLALDQGSCRIYRVAEGRAYLGICFSDAAPADAGGISDIIITLVAADVDGWHARITARGWQCESAPRINPTYDIYHFFVRDPNGYRLEVQRFARDDWDSAPA